MLGNASPQRGFKQVRKEVEVRIDALIINQAHANLRRITLSLYDAISA